LWLISSRDEVEAAINYLLTFIRLGASNKDAVFNIGSEALSIEAPGVEANGCVSFAGVIDLVIVITNIATPHPLSVSGIVAVPHATVPGAGNAATGPFTIIQVAWALEAVKITPSSISSLVPVEVLELGTIAEDILERDQHLCIIICSPSGISYGGVAFIPLAQSGGPERSNLFFWPDHLWCVFPKVVIDVLQRATSDGSFWTAFINLATPVDGYNSVVSDCTRDWINTSQCDVVALQGGCFGGTSIPHWESTEEEQSRYKKADYRRHSKNGLSWFAVALLVAEY